MAVRSRMVLIEMQIYAFGVSPALIVQILNRSCVIYPRCITGLPLHNNPTLLVITFDPFGVAM